MPDSRLHQLSALGQSVWIDFLSRDLIHSGGLARKMEEDAVTGVTSNPTIFQKAISQGEAYDEQLRELVEHEQDAKEIFIALAGRDIGEACDLMRSVWDEGKGLRGTSRSRSTRRSPTTRTGRSPRPGASPRSSTGRTST